MSQDLQDVKSNEGLQKKNRYKNFSIILRGLLFGASKRCAVKRMQEVKPQRNLTLVDFQNDFVAPNGALTFDNGKGDPELIQRTRSFFEALPTGVFTSAIVTYDTHFADTYTKSEESKQFPLHCVEDTSGWQLAVNPFLIASKIPIVQHLRKNTYDMWAGTIDKVNMNIVKPTQEVVLFGVASDICDRAALLGWMARDVKVTILSDLTRGIFKEMPEVLQEEPFKKAVQRGQVNLMTSRAFLQHMHEERSYS